MKVSYTIDELNDWYIECQENAEIPLYVGERPNGHFSMSKENIQLGVAFSVAILFMLYMLLQNL